MILSWGWPAIAVMTLVMITAGATNGLAGFGFAVVGTMSSATML